MGEDQKNYGFSLIELLVVIIIIALLMAIIIPGLVKSKELTKRTICRAHLKQFTLGMICYSQDYRQRLPSFTAPHGPHVHDVAKEFIETMSSGYGIELEYLFCPSADRRRIQNVMEFNNSGADVYYIGYSLWIPRFVVHYNVEIPPKETISSLIVVDDSSYWGPKNTSDRLGITNPILTDEVMSIAGATPDIDLSVEKQARSNSNHLWRELMEISNQSFVDGHVEKIPADKLKTRYGYADGTNGWLYR